jgi:hypothetical protein
MLKRIVAATVISTGLAISVMGNASADGSRDHNGTGNPWSAEWKQDQSSYKNGGRKIVVERKIHRRVVNGTLPIRKLLDLDRSYKGYRVKSVAVKIRPGRSYGRVKLLVNGRTVDRERLNNDTWITLRTNEDKTIDRDLRTLELGVRGKVYIKDIKVTLAKPAPRRRHTDARPHRADRVPPKVDVVTTRTDHDAFDRILRIILRDMKRQNATF